MADDRIKWKLGNLVWRQLGAEVSKFRQIGETGDRQTPNIESRLLRQGQWILEGQKLPTWDVTLTHLVVKYSGGHDEAVKCKMWICNFELA